MASIFGHAISIVGFKKLFPDNSFGRKTLILGVVSAMVPDIDVIGYNFGITAIGNYGYLGHRGLTHSILFGVIWSIIILNLFHKKDETSFNLKGVFYFLCIVSHGLLDSMTTGGDGITFFLPLDTTRYFFPYRFIEVSPIGLSSFFSKWGLEVLLNEFKYIGIPSLLMYVIGFFANKKIYK